MTERPTNSPGTSIDSLRRAVVALRTSTRHSNQAPTGADLYWTIGVIGQAAAALDLALVDLAKTLTDERTADRMTVVEGPFAGDTPAAVTTAHDWLLRARDLLAAEALPAIENAQIGIAGLAGPHTD